MFKEALNNLRSKKGVIIIDDSIKSPASYLIFPAENITDSDVAFLVNYARGVVCVALSEERMKELGLSVMPRRGKLPTAQFSLSVEARHNVSTGISAADRATTLHVIATTKNPKLDLVTPGHIFPIKANKGGVLVHSGIAEAVVDLLTFANQTPAGAFSHILTKHGDYASEEEVIKLSKELHLPVIKITDLIRERLSKENVIEKISEANLPTGWAGDFRAICFRSKLDSTEHLVLVKGSPESIQNALAPIPVRVQAENRLGDLLGTKTLLQRKNIAGALQRIAQLGSGVFVYIRHPREGTLSEQIKKLKEPQATINKTIMVRQHGTGAQILKALGVKKIALLTNSSLDLSGIEAFNLEIAQVVPYDAR